MKPYLDIDVFNRLVGHIYDAATDIEQWPVYMQKLVETFNAKSCLLRLQHLDTKEVGIWISQGMDQDFQPRYRDYYVHIDPLIPAIAKIPVGTIIQTATFMPISEFRRTEYYNDYAKPQEQFNVAGGFLANDDNQIAVIGLHRSNDRDTYTEDELAMLQMLTPHMQRAFQVNRHLMNLHRKDSAVGEVLDRLPTGIILVDAQARPISVNQAAENLTQGNSVLKIKAGNMVAITREYTLALKRLIHEAANSDSRQGGSLVIKHPYQEQSLSVLVTPIDHNNGFEIGADSSKIAAALYLSSSDQQYIFPLAVLKSLYDLTAAEARVATSLANGLSLEAIANNLAISKNTVRNQLKSCFHKTGVKRQAELVKLILCGIPAIPLEQEMGPRPN